MASKPKRPHISSSAPDTPDSSESDLEETSDSSDLSDGPVEARSSSDALGDDEGGSDDVEGVQAVVGGVPKPEIKVEFQARTPVISDFDGIIRFLTSLFRGSDKVNLPELAEYIINQRNVGSVVTQSPQDFGDDGDEDEENDYHENVFGLTTVVKLRREKSLSKGLIEYLIDTVKKDDNLTKLSELLGNPDNSVGLVISERISNIPPQLSVPLYESIFNEIRKARAKGLPHFDFTHFVIICRILVEDENSQGTSVNYRYPEEEVIEELSQVIETVCPPNAQVARVAINGVSYKPLRRILVFKAEQADEVYRNVRDAFPNS